MKKRDDIQTFHNSARIVGSTRILTPPQQQMSTQNVSSTAASNQYQILNVLRDAGGNITQTQNIQYTYSPAPPPPSNMQKSSIVQSPQNQTVHVVNTGNINISNRTKPSNSGAVTPTPINVTSPAGASIQAGNLSGQNFPRLKVEDALSYLDQVKYKFGNQPQVYNDFLDIMKEFKSQSIDTPGVIQRVSNLFKGHPELIVGFNTFLPPGYKIEVQANDQGFAYQVSVSVPSPSGNATISTQHSPPTKFVPGSHVQPPVNLITHTSSHIQQQQQSQSDQRNITSQHIAGSGGGGGVNVNVTQNFTRDRNDRSLPVSSSINCQSGTQPAQQQQQQQPSQPPPQPASQTVSTNQQSSGLTESNNLHRMQPIFQNDNQPVQFNQAIVYVNKIKCRFQEQPEKYKHFLRILHKYQNEQRRKDGKSNSPLTETEVFKQVANLFDNQEDLLREFGQFLPDASPQSINKNVLAALNDSHEKSSAIQHTPVSVNVKQVGSNNLVRNNVLSPMEIFQGSNIEKDFHHVSSYSGIPREKDVGRNNLSGSNQKYGNVSGVKRSPAAMQMNHLNRGHDRNEPPMKRHKPIFRDVSYADAARSGTLQDYAFFDKVREALRSPDVYDNFLRCLTLYNQEIVSKSELMTLVTPFLSKEPELLKKFHEFLKFSSAPEPISLSVAQRQDHRIQIQTDTAAEIDVAQCKRLGTSYCALPKTSEPKKCSGRTPLCREVLNDTWVSFPSWSEDSTFNTSRKTQYEEFIYRCEDERFELDVVIETNSATIRVLEGVQKKMSKMTPDELSRFKLDDSLGGTSQTIHQRALRRIYGDKAPDIIEGLKKNPNVAVPVVLRRLKAKEEEWREAQKSFNQQWREQNEKYYLKSLDHQGINFKHADIKALRSKSLMNQIETAYEERNEGNNGDAIPGPHMVLHYKDKSILDDAASLLIHHVKRQTGIQKLEKARIKHIMRQFVPELFFAPRQPLSDDEKEDVDENRTKNSTLSAESKTPATSEGNTCNKDNEKTSQASERLSTDSSVKVESTAIKQEPDATRPSLNSCQQAPGGNLQPIHAANAKHSEEAYTLFYANSNWYYFLRLHAILCERLRTMYERTQIMAAEEEKFKTNRRESVAVALRLKPQNEFEIPDYYPAFLDMLKSLLDGNMDSTTYEDKLRDMYGIHAYTAFTLDRVVSNAVRQLQFCVTERNALECFELYQLESREHATGGLCSTAYKRAAAELAYQRRVESTLQEEMYFKIFIYKIDCRVTIEMLENDTEDASTTNYEQGQVTSKYVERLTNPSLSGSLRVSSRNNSLNGLEVEIKVEKPDNEMDFTARKPLFLQRNIRKFNSRIPPNVKYENGEANPKTTSSSDSPQDPTASILTTSTSSVPPPLILPPKNNTLTRNLPERVGQPGSFNDFFVDDQEQVKFNYQTYKTVFCNTTNKGYILYRYNSLKRAKQNHSKVTVAMHEKFDAYVQKWLSINATETQSSTIVDWLQGKNQLNFLPCKTVVKRDNNTSETPYYPFNRYIVEFFPTTSSDSMGS